MTVGTIATASDVHVSVPLSNVSVAYRSTLQIADKVLPVIPVNKEADKYFTFGKENFMLVDTLRGDGAPSKRARYTVSTGTYSVNYHALSDVVTDRMVENADAPLRPLINATNFLTDLIGIRKEYEVSNMLFNTTTFSGYTAAVGTQWDRRRRRAGR